MQMGIQLDHFFILSEPGAPQADFLVDIGVVEGMPNDHPGQGTSNRRFFFENAGLELLYIRDAEEAMNGPASGLQCVEREAQSGASPFGIVVRRTDDSADDPFPGWRYYPQYFGADKYFQVGENCNELQEPLCICMPIMPPAASGQPLPREPFTEVTELHISVPVNKPSEVLETVGRCERISLTPGAPHHVEIVFTDGRAGQSKDLRPGLPLCIRW